MGFQVGIKYSTPAPFPQVGIKRAYVPAASSTHLAYKQVESKLVEKETTLRKYNTRAPKYVRKQN
ncbi:hypothetical protein PRIPAC_84318 [Pristionchus pacificus]|uniref:Uncharacterized protein n=1 Tax=Pristionchus pacificus TaxID=54126 RepID=A0A2A6BKH0_PRIPA|nr:hypothetical protein PRIPAC_84318 [Pristionchus pacificus]|eukprot:PDM66410.1 hypothetical protein PRIPAC_47827 [Pristionchus pacificus]